MKHFITTIFALLFLATTASAQSGGGVSKVIHQTYEAAEVNSLTLDFYTSNVSVRQTKGSRILIEVTVEANVSNPRLIDFLANNGRYELAVKRDQVKKHLIIAAPKHNDVIMVAGNELEETISYIVYVPDSVKYVKEENATASND